MKTILKWETWNRSFTVIATAATVGAFIIAIISMVSPGTLTTAMDALLGAVRGSKQETSADARKELVNLGIPFERSYLFQAALTNDSRAVDLLLAAGLHWSSGLDTSSHGILEPLLEVYDAYPENFYKLVAKEGELDHLICKVLLTEELDRPLWYQFVYPMATKVIGLAKERGIALSTCDNQADLVETQRGYWQNYTPIPFDPLPLRADEEFMAKFEDFVASLS